MKKLFISLLTIIIMALVTALTLPFFIPVEEYRKSALAFLQEKTGHQVSISGGISLTLLPQVALKLEGVQVDNAEGFTGPYLAKIERVDLALELMPLLSRQVKIDALSLVNPEIWLEENRAGQKNWALPKQAATPASESREDSPAFTYDINHVKIDRAKVHALLNGQNIVAEDLTAQWQNQQATVQSKVNLRGVIWNVNLKMQQPQEWWQGGKSAVELSLQQPEARFEFKGDLSAKPQDVLGTAMFKGKLSASINSLASAMGALPDQSLALESMDTEITAQRILMNPMDLQLGSTKISGALNLDWSAKVPHLSGEVTLPELELATAEEPTAPSAEGNASGGEWDSTPIDFGFLRQCSMDMAIKIGKLTTSVFSLRDVELKLRNQAGVLALTLEKATALQGAITAKLAMNATEKTPRWQLQGNFQHLAAQEALALVMKNPRLSGAMQGEIALNSQGNSLREWMHGLQGGGKLELPDGMIEGFSLPKLFRNVLPQAGTTESTKHAEIRLRFTADQGVLAVQEGTLKAQDFQAELGGSVDMGNQRVDLRLLPKMVSQLGAPQAVSLLVPLKIVGKFENIVIRPDVKGAVTQALQHPEEVKALKEEGKAALKNLKEKGATIKENFQELKKGKTPEALGNLLKSLDQGGVPLPQMPDGLKKPEDTSGQPDGGAGAGEQPDAGAGADTGGEGAGPPPQAADQGGPPALPGN